MKFKINEATNKEWKILKDNTSVMLCRFFGKTKPCISFVKGSGSGENTIWGRDDNGRNPSKVYSAENINVDSINSDILPHISNPRPTKEDIDNFIYEINKMFNYFNKDFFKQGQSVKYGNFDATIIKYYSDGMWEIRVPGGIVCVSGADLI